jgi:Zn-dependent protease
MVLLFSLVVILFSAIIHEYMHGWMADRLGDPTARDAGRLTLNPLQHIDPFGSVLLPLLLVMTNSPIFFGYAKPVPFNPYNLRDKKFGSAKVAFAGPLANIVTAVFFGLVIRFFSEQLFDFSEAFSPLLVTIVQINLVLSIFNLVPIPPLDGSKVLAAVLPYHWQIRFLELERYGMILVLFFVMFGFGLIVPIINFLFSLIVGV